MWTKQERAKKLWRVGATLVGGIFLLGFSLHSAQADSESLKLGVVKGAVDGPFYIAKDKGYFGAENLVGQLERTDYLIVQIVNIDGGHGYLLALRTST